jgi:hypothetical protein
MSKRVNGLARHGARGLIERMSHLAWKFGSGPDDFYAATSFF